MNIWKIDKQTGLPRTPPGYVWKLWFEPETHPRNPYMMHLKRGDSDEHWYYASRHRSTIVYARMLEGATGSTIRPRHVRRAARSILREHRKYVKAQAENQHGSNRVTAGDYPPNVL